MTDGQLFLLTPRQGGKRMDTTVQFNYTTFENPIWLATGPLCKNIDDVRRLSKWRTIPTIPYGSGTIEERAGNPDPTYDYHPILGSINALGMRNKGKGHHRADLSEACDIAKRAGKQVVFSAAGGSPEQYAQLLEIAKESGVAIVELNMGCPNVWFKGKQKRIMSYDPKGIQQTLALCTEVIGPRRIELLVKLSLMLDSVLFYEVGSVIGEFKVVTGVVVVNTGSGGFRYASRGKSAINPTFSKGLAGITGPWMKQFGLGHIVQLKDMQEQGIIGPHVKFIGCGGIWSGQDAIEYLDAGASAVQVGTAAFEYGESKLFEIYTEYLGHMELSEMAANAAS